jgi:putative hydrolase of HD superfamily
MERINKQIEFLIEIDRLKSINRRNYISDGARNENDAEHSWYFAMAALLLAEYSNEKIDMQKVIQMALIHDIVEIDAGDTFIYDEKAKKHQHDKEQKAAKRIFGLLPDEQKKFMYDIWNEFEENITKESKFARSIDRLVAILLNDISDGKAWKEHNIEYSQVYEVNKRIAEGSSKLWALVEKIINKAADEGKLDKDPANHSSY